MGKHRCGTVPAHQAGGQEKQSGKGAGHAQVPGREAAEELVWPEHSGPGNQPERTLGQLLQVLHHGQDWTPPSVGDTTGFHRVLCCAPQEVITASDTRNATLQGTFGKPGPWRPEHRETKPSKQASHTRHTEAMWTLPSRQLVLLSTCTEKEHRRGHPAILHSAGSGATSLPLAHRTALLVLYPKDLILTNSHQAPSQQRRKEVPLIPDLESYRGIRERCTQAFPMCLVI